MWPRDDGEKITYTTFMELVRDDKVKEIDISASGTITGELTDGTKFRSSGAGERGVSEADEAVLRAHSVEYEFKPASNNWFLSIAGLLLPVLLIIGFFVWTAPGRPARWAT